MEDYITLPDGTREKALTFADVWKMFKESDKKLAKTSRLVDSISKQLGSIGNNNGAVAEEYFFNSFKRKLAFHNERFDYVEREIKHGNGKISDEYDIVLYSGKSIGIIEVKYKAHENDISGALNKAETFKEFFPNFKAHRFYLGLASFSFTKRVETLALNAGLAVIKQVGKTMVVLDERIKTF